VTDDLKFQITEDDTALLAAYPTKSANLSSFGIPNGFIYDSVAQELDIETGESATWRDLTKYHFLTITLLQARLYSPGTLLNTFLSRTLVLRSSTPGPTRPMPLTSS
jgi:hypothetical protein